MIELKNICKYYNHGNVNELCLFKNFNLKIETNSFVSVVGSNGSGKTSMLNLICGSIPLDSGEISIDGVSINKYPEHTRSKWIGRVYQNPAMGTAGNLTILENIALFDNKLKPFNLKFSIDKSRIDFYRDGLSKLSLSLEDKLDVKVSSLSGGQRQALSLFMSTLTNTKLLILDEHTAALDPKTADTIMELTDNLVKAKKLTAIMVTHNLRYAVNYGDRLIMMHSGDIVMDKAYEDKSSLSVSDILEKFTEISIECGN